MPNLQDHAAAVLHAPARLPDRAPACGVAPSHIDQPAFVTMHGHRENSVPGQRGPLQLQTQYIYVQYSSTTVLVLYITVYYIRYTGTYCTGVKYCKKEIAFFVVNECPTLSFAGGSDCALWCTGLNRYSTRNVSTVQEHRAPLPHYPRRCTGYGQWNSRVVRLGTFFGGFLAGRPFVTRCSSSLIIYPSLS